MKRWVFVATLVLAGWAASTASARIEHYLITVTASGPGVVTGNGDGGSFNCSNASCSALIREHTDLTLTATPDDGAQFTGWGGACEYAGTNSQCEIEISGPKDITAGFGTPPPPPPPKATLTVDKAGTGTGYVGGVGGIDCGPTCSAALPPGTSVTLLAVPDDGSTFTGWTGGGCSTGDQCTVTVSADTEVTATFTHVDTEPPHIQTLRAAAAPGASVRLRYRVYDDSGESRELLTVQQGKKMLGQVSVPLGRVHYRRLYTTSFRVPANAKPGHGLYCAVAIDAAGNRSKRSCSAFTVT